MKKMLLNLADQLLSNEQMKAVKGGYDGSASNGLAWNQPWSPTRGENGCATISYWSGSPTLSSNNCSPGGY